MISTSIISYHWSTISSRHFIPLTNVSFIALHLIEMDHQINIPFFYLYLLVSVQIPFSLSVDFSLTKSVLINWEVDSKIGQTFSSIKRSEFPFILVVFNPHYATVAGKKSRKFQLIWWIIRSNEQKWFFIPSRILSDSDFNWKTLVILLLSPMLKIVLFSLFSPICFFDFYVDTPWIRLGTTIAINSLVPLVSLLMTTIKSFILPIVKMLVLWMETANITNASNSRSWKWTRKSNQSIELSKRCDSR